MPLINCKVELKLKWTKHCVLSAAGNKNNNDNDRDNNSNNIIFTINDRKLHITVVLYPQEATKNYLNFLANDLKDQFIGTNKKQEVRMKIRLMNIETFSNQIILESMDYLF